MYNCVSPYGRRDLGRVQAQELLQAVLEALNNYICI